MHQTHISALTQLTGQDRALTARKELTLYEFAGTTALKARPRSVLLRHSKTEVDECNRTVLASVYRYETISIH